MDTTVHHFIFDSLKPGRTLVLMGAVHGNEKCGTVALERLKNRLETGDIKISSGKVILVPLTNPEAYKANKRFIDRNLNRCLYPKQPAECKAYEDHLDTQICSILDQADYLLDIHSYTAGGPPFIFMGGKDEEEKAFAASLGVTNNFVWGWGDAFKVSGIPEKESQGTTEYTRSLGKHAVTIECGQHNDSVNPDVGYKAALHAMHYLGIIDSPTLRQESAGLNTPPVSGKKSYAKMVTVIKNENVTLARSFSHFEFIKKGEVLAQRADGSSITATADGYAILPNPTAAKGAEMLYLAIDEEPLPKPAQAKTISKTTSQNPR